MDIFFDPKNESYIIKEKNSVLNINKQDFENMKKCGMSAILSKLHKN